MLKISISKRIFFILLCILIIFTGIEGSLRFYEFWYAPNCLLPKTDVFKNSDPFLTRQICLDARLLQFEFDGILKMKPNQYYETININSQGFRGDEFNQTKQEDVKRIFILGSNAFGATATSDKMTISGFLQKNLNEKSTLDYEVLNAGIIQSDSFRNLYLIENQLLNLESNLLILYTGWIDSSQQRLNQTITKQTSDNDQFFKFKNFQFYRTPFVLKNLLVKDSPQDSNNISLDLFQKNQQVAINWKQNIDKICKLGQENNFKTLIVIQPLSNSGKKVLTPFESKYIENELTLDAYFKIIEQMKYLNNCDKSIDLSNLFDEYQEPIFTSKGDTSDLGNQIIAERLYNEVILLLE